jgi:hypothetical protein
VRVAVAALVGLARLLLEELVEVVLVDMEPLAQAQPLELQTQAEVAVVETKVRRLEQAVQA